MNRPRWAALLGLSLLACQARAQEELDARLTRVEGTVYLHIHDHADDDFLEAQADEQLEAGDRVKTGSDGHAELAFNGDSVVELGPDSDFLIASLHPKSAEFQLDFGSLVAKIRSLVLGERMEFHTPQAVASIRGTELAVTQEEDRPAQVGVFDEGKVEVRSPDQEGKVSLGPGQETEVRHGEAPAPARKLAALAGHRARLEGVRQRVQFLRGNWQRRNATQRRAIRSQMKKRKAVRANRLRKMKARRRAIRRLNNGARHKAPSKARPPKKGPPKKKAKKHP